MNTSFLTAFIKQEALKLGFDACGIARVSAVSIEHRKAFESWLKNGFHAEMGYMERNQDKRLDPSLLVDGAKSVIVVAMNYYHQAENYMKHSIIAKYAINPDYHQVIKNRLRELLLRINNQGINISGRPFVDSAPVAERYWAAKAGIGWIGKNRNLIIKGKGSYFLLGELFVDIELEYDKPAPERCGSCNRCLEACPGSALSINDGLNSNRCISYLTIEKKGHFNINEARLCGENGFIFGCDICQDVCPWNRFSREQTLPVIQPVPDILSMKLDDLKDMSDGSFKKKFENTCLSRTGLEGLRRNYDTLKKNQPS